MQNDDVGALRAWNQIGKPRVNRVRIDGLHHTRYQTVAEVMAIQPNMLLTAEMFDRARRRLGELPDHATTRLAVKPEADGFATVDVVVVEIAAVPHGAVEWAGASARAIANREIDVSVPGVERPGRGLVCRLALVAQSSRRQRRLRRAASRRLAGRLAIRRRVAVGHLRRRAGIPRWSRRDRMAALTISDWLTALRAVLGVDRAGRVERRSQGRVDRRLARAGRFRRSADAVGRRDAVDAAERRNRLRLRRRARDRAVVSPTLAAGSLAERSAFERVSDAAPLALWPGAGEGQVRRAAAARASAAERRRRGPDDRRRRVRPHARVRQRGSAALAGAADARRGSASRGSPTWRARRVRLSAGATPVQVDVGVGLRIKIPGTPGVLRADVAHGLRDGANALTFGWLF